VSRYSRGPKRRPLSSITPREMDRMREHDDREQEFKHNSGDWEPEEDRIEARQQAWLTDLGDEAA
jgi:hypothetical protein